jgi:hypothetical protein
MPKTGVKGLIIALEKSQGEFSDPTKFLTFSSKIAIHIPESVNFFLSSCRPTHDKVQPSRCDVNLCELPLKGDVTVCLNF